MIDVSLIEELKNAPLLLAAVKDQETIDYFNSLIPYSTGFEIECGYGANPDLQSFESIPDIMEVNNSSYEQRYRIPNGIKGMICLYNIADQLVLNSELNFGSGIHYHVDCSKDSEWGDIKELIHTHADWILKELDEWGYTGSYNSRGINGPVTRNFEGNWVRFNGLLTIEFRIGEMTFDYKLLLKRIIHCNSIVQRLKSNLYNYSEPEYEIPNYKALIHYSKINHRSVLANLQAKILLLEEANRKLSEVKEVKQETIVVKNRIHRIN